ncbi:polymer-forming cytoskeletal protein [Sungkyunkwania multivorans]|uniref:Polymer-forming cytoskeletal protein n=1 Tax=Sungkyunkwania multivorans TaxID=1173618 RepID=A0ABW3D0F0_9FLAO
MFSERKNKGTEAGSSYGLCNRIAKGTSITGDIISEADFRVDGEFNGNIKTSGKVVIGSTGTIQGKIECTNADIEGRFSGELFVSQMLSLKSTANIKGEVVINKLSVEVGAAFNANCTMKADGVMPLNAVNEQKAEKTA